MPGLDSFVAMEKSQRIRNFLEVINCVIVILRYEANKGVIKLNILFYYFQSLVVSDVIFAQVMGKSAAGLLLKVLCNCNDFPRVVSDLGVKVIIHLYLIKKYNNIYRRENVPTHELLLLQALILNTATVPAVDKKGVTRGYMANDLVCVVVGEVNVEAERVVAVMNVPPREGQTSHPPMGLVHVEDLPDAYK